MKQILKQVERWILGILLVLVTTFLLLLLFGIRPAIVLSGSMEPTISTGSLCFVDTRKADTVFQPGDIVAFRSGGMLVTHRIKERTPDGYRTKGDANQTADLGMIRQEDIQGETLFWIPHLGYLIKKFHTPAGTVLFISMILVLLLHSMLDREQVNPVSKPHKTKPCPKQEGTSGERSSEK